MALEAFPLEASRNFAASKPFSSKKNVFHLLRELFSRGQMVPSAQMHEQLRLKPTKMHTYCTKTRTTSSENGGGVVPEELLMQPGVRNDSLKK